MQRHAKPCKGIPSIARHTQACWTWVPVCSVLCSVLCSTKSQRIGTWPLWITRGGKHDCAMLHGVSPLSPLRDPWFVQFLNLKKDTYLLLVILPTISSFDSVMTLGCDTKYRLERYVYTLRTYTYGRLSRLILIDYYWAKDKERH